ncbi:hypothetical protein [Streptomyces mirabilis]|uniref:hypothetical protein n=1 Tax=Streptomyces mirabilis TaxID=68239 RepID=UPI00367B0348
MAQGVSQPRTARMAWGQQAGRGCCESGDRHHDLGVRRSRPSRRLQHRLDERTVSALYAATQGHLRRTTYQAEEALTRDQALVDLRTLRRLDLVESVGHARTQRYTGGPVLRKIRTEVHAEFHADLYREPYRQP